MLAQAPLQAVEPAAADPAVVDPDQNLLKVIRDREHPRTWLVRKPSASFLTTLAAAMRHVAKERGITDDAAWEQSGLKIAVHVDRAGDLANEITIVNKHFFTGLKPEWLVEVTGTPTPAVPEEAERRTSARVTKLIGPSDWLQAVAPPETKPVLDRLAMDPVPAREGAKPEERQVRSGAAVVHAAATLDVARAAGQVIAVNQPLPEPVKVKLERFGIEFEPAKFRFVPQPVSVGASAPVYDAYERELDEAG